MGHDIADRLLAANDGDPHQLATSSLMAMMYRSANYKVVPRDYWEEGDSAGGWRAAFLVCQCGASVCVEVARVPVACTCARWFFYDGTTVRAFNSPARPETAARPTSA